VRRLFLFGGPFDWDLHMWRLVLSKHVGTLFGGPFDWDLPMWRLKHVGTQLQEVPLDLDAYLEWARTEMEQREKQSASYFESAYSLRYGRPLDPSVFASTGLRRRR
jgi:hypothetical protein